VDGFSAVGYWWLEQNEAQQITGDLTYDPRQGFSLALHGFFGSLERLNKEQPDSTTIYGVTSDGKHISLYDCMTRGTKISMPGFPTEAYSSSHAIVGSSHVADAARVFKRCYVELSLLGDWFEESPLSTTMSFKNEKYLTGVTIAYSRPKQKHFVLPFGKMSLANGLQTDGSPVHGLSLTPSPHVRFTLSERSTYEDILSRAVFPLRDLLSLGLNCPIQVTSVEFGKTKQPTPGESHFKYYFGGANGSVEVAENRLKPWMLFSMSDLLAERGSLTNWFSAADSLQEMVSLVFGIIHSSTFYLDLRFLAAVQALEIYHRRRFTSQEMNQDDYDKRVSEIRALVPGSLGKWTEHKLGSNAKPFQQRMREVYDAIAPVIGELAGSREVFLNDLRNSRNYYTHRDDSTVTTYANGADLYFLFEAVMTMLKACLLLEVGFSPARARDLFMNNQDFLWLRRQLTGHWTPPSKEVSV